MARTLASKRQVVALERSKTRRTLLLIQVHSLLPSQVTSILLIAFHHNSNQAHLAVVVEQVEAQALSTHSKARTATTSLTERTLVAGRVDKAARAAVQ